MQEAEVRSRLENAYGHLKKVRKDWRKEQREKDKQAARSAPSTPGKASAPSTPARASGSVPAKRATPAKKAAWVENYKEGVHTYSVLVFFILDVPDIPGQLPKW